MTAGRSHYGHLLAAGVRLFEYSAGIHHAKIALADDPWAMVGSANLDYRSMRLNFEPNLLIHSREGNGELARILEQDFGLCQEIDPVVFSHRPFRQKFAEAALRPLSPRLRAPLRSTGGPGSITPHFCRPIERIIWDDSHGRADFLLPLCPVHTPRR